MTDFEIIVGLIVAFAYIYFLIDYLLKENKKMDLQEKIKELEKQLQELKEEVNKGEEEFPKLHEAYYFIDSISDIWMDEWEGSHIENKKLEIGNAFKTRKEAEFMIERLKVLEELRKLSRRFKYNQENWNICYDYDNNQIRVCVLKSLQSDIHNFNSEEEAQAAIDKIGEDRLKKYYFMLGDED